MTKTIEDLAREYVNDIYSGDIDFVDEAESVLSWLFDKPLGDRLTAAEKERVRKMYWQAAMDWVGVYDVLEEIFGNEFFREGEV